MSITNDEIVQRIKEIRQNQNKTQQDLATLLGKTAASISDMERGKVQITASDLSIIADYLNCPLELFFGEEYGDQYFRDVIALLKREGPEGRMNSLAVIEMLLKMQQLADLAQSESGREITKEEIGNFYKYLITLTLQFKEYLSQLEKLQKDFSQLMMEQGIPIPTITLPPPDKTS